MTNHWRDIKNTDLILINGANPAEAHPVGFQWFMRAKLDRGAKMIHADPRFTRTSAVADMYLRIRTGSDVVYFGGLINHVLQNNLFHDEYVRNYTNASFVVKDGYAFNDGLLSGYDPDKRTYNTATWAHGPPRRRHERRERPRQHPGQHGPRDLVGDPPGLLEDPSAWTEDDRGLRRRERAQEVRPTLLELLRHELQQVHGQHAQGVVWRR